jgi:hypothetical protein
MAGADAHAGSIHEEFTHQADSFAASPAMGQGDSVEALVDLVPVDVTPAMVAKATDDDRASAAWHEQIERLRDPSHWACLTRSRLAEIGGRAGPTIDAERTFPLEFDYEDWLARGSGGAANADLIERLLADAPPGAESFWSVASAAPGA